MNAWEIENQILFYAALTVFLLALFFELHLRAKETIKSKAIKPDSKRIDKGLSYLREHKKEKITNDLWQEITGISHATASRDLSHLVEMGVLEKKGRGRGVHYLRKNKLK